MTARTFSARGLVHLADWLEAHGFQLFANHLAGQHNTANWYACRYTDMPARPCECNDDKRMQLVVWPHLMESGAYGPQSPRSESCEVEVCGEAIGRWWSLKCYSLNPADLRAKLAEIEPQLIAAWNALAPIATDNK